MEFRTLERTKEALSPSSKSHHYPALAAISGPHIESFNAMFNNGAAPGLLDLAVLDIPHVHVFDGQKGDPLDNRNKVEFWLSNPTVAKPVIDGKKALQTLLYPSECRERGVSYTAKMQIKLNWRVNGGATNSEVRPLGKLPIMVGSIKCNLEGKSPAEMVKKHEDADEFGGYFISNGIERLIRLLILPRRNYPTAIVRPSFENRGPTFSKFAVQIRSVRDDQSSQTLTLHYCTDGAISLRFSYRKNEYMIPVMLILKALAPITDKEIFERATMGDYGNTFLTDRVEMLLRSFRRYSLFTREQCLDYIGSKFAVMFDSAEDTTERQVGLDFLNRIVLVHLKSTKAKSDLLLFMIQKLYGVVSGDFSQDNPDSLQFQEVLLGGHLFLGIIKEKLSEWLATIKIQILQDLRRNQSSVDFVDKKYMSRVFGKTLNACDIGKKLEYFLATGNLVSPSGLDLQQTSGFTIIAEKLNFYRYVAHFRSIHRGAFFTEMKTTTVRKLLPESWGFMCPVHTPDGSPCGLLNHLSHTCLIITAPVDVSGVPSAIASLGAGQMIGSVPFINSEQPLDFKGLTEHEIVMKKREQSIVSIQLDGKVIGWCTAAKALSIAQTLREWKIKGLQRIPLELEIGYVPLSSGGQYPGLYLFSTPARFMRAVHHLATDAKDLIGPFEQVYMDIACIAEDIVPGITTHNEYNPTDMLSLVASLTPFSDFNQSPRNMYQCQMGKQTMGTPVQNFHHRTDNKMYRLQTGQTPIVRPKAHDNFDLDGYPNGMNAVVCVISYTGYDMEDASILAKSAFERGYGYGTVYKGEWVDLADHRPKGEPITHHFGFLAEGSTVPTLPKKKLDHALKFIDVDGLPLVGVRLKQGDPMYAFVDDVTQKVTIKPYKGMEDCIVDQVRLIGTDTNDQPLQKIHIKLRIPRPPIIGDKFSSRHGQKGVISQKWPSVDMPFSETGIIPDVIINPHAFPSRMTIGMFIESLAGKAGALHGHSQDATAFKFNEENAAADFFGEQLASAGFNYHGNEAMYSGITGEEFKADIYIGVVYYQRLRHMVSDKYQVRTTGPVHNLTQQPIKGRKRAGGIRLGEMERDSLLAHGVSFILQDRLMNCSDYSQCHICRACGSILSPMQIYRDNLNVIPSRGERMTCKTCGHGKAIDIVAIPYVFRYLCTELVSMNVKLSIEVTK
ncbi:hypothetical protein BC833DRAFT_624620 [Globomyces pollinis-pini]|nr:hypothetical protein BC833DRAFT_624620 [Globomyces pollinis-pini]